jgi:restriction system protein
MARRSTHSTLIEIIPFLAGSILICFVVLPGRGVQISAFGKILVGGAAITLVLTMGFIFLRFLKRPSCLKKDFIEGAPQNPEKSSQNSEPVQSPRPLNTVEKLRVIDWYQFEKIVAIAYQKAGFCVERRGGANPDGGIDLILTGPAGERKAVQCKHWKKSDVGVKTLREFLGALKDEQMEKGVFVAMRGYTGEARQFAERNGVELLNEAGLAKMLETDGARFDSDILALLNGKRKFCPKCENEMVLRTAVKGPNTGSRFWGCSTYPRCHCKLPSN